jgi:NACHT domain- and WD repeat-containing protein
LVCCQIEKYHGRIFVSHALSYLTASKNGLSDVELEDVLSLDEEVLNDVFQHWLPPIRRIPPLLIPRLHDELSSYIMQREANGTIVIYWYHRQFIFVARERYLADMGHKIYIHTSLAHYFLGTWGGGQSKPFKYSPTQIALMSTRRKETDLADRKVPVQPLSYGPDPHVPGKMTYNLRKLSELPFHLFESRQFLVLRQEVR